MNQTEAYPISEDKSQGSAPCSNHFDPFARLTSLTAPNKKHWGPFKGAPETLDAEELLKYEGARAHQPWHRPPRSHRPYGIKPWDKVNFAIFSAMVAAHVWAFCSFQASGSPSEALAMVLIRVPIALAFVDFCTGLTHALFDGIPTLVPKSLYIGTGRLAPVHEHRDTATITSFRNSELLADMQPTIIGETFACHAIARVLGFTPDYLFLLIAALLGIWTQVIHKHAHLRGHAKAVTMMRKRKQLVALTFFKLQDWGVVMSHEAHKTHHQKGTNVCLMTGWCNGLLNLFVAKDDEYEIVPTALLEQKIYDLEDVEAERVARLEQWYGKDAVTRE